MGRPVIDRCFCSATVSEATSGVVTTVASRGATGRRAAAAASECASIRSGPMASWQCIEPHLRPLLSTVYESHCHHPDLVSQLEERDADLRFDERLPRLASSVVDRGSATIRICAFNGTAMAERIRARRRSRRVVKRVGLLLRLARLLGRGLCQMCCKTCRNAAAVFFSGVASPVE